MANKPDDPTFEQTDGFSGVDLAAGALFDNCKSLCAGLNMSPMDFCVAMANVQGWILASSKDMPEDVAMKRIDDLTEVARRAYRMRRSNTKEGDT